MSGLKINYAKSEVVAMGMALDEGLRVAKLLNCKLVDFPIVYLGLPSSDRALTSSDWDPTVRKVGTRVDPGRLNLCLQERG